MYYTLTQEELELYHTIHNIFYKKFDGFVLSLARSVEIDGYKFDSVIIKVLELKNVFITYKKLLNKITK
jgi:hypothetical protein